MRSFKGSTSSVDGAILIPVSARPIHNPAGGERNTHPGSESKETYLKKERLVYMPRWSSVPEIFERQVELHKRLGTKNIPEIPKTEHDDYELMGNTRLLELHATAQEFLLLNSDHKRIDEAIKRAEKIEAVLKKRKLL